MAADTSPAAIARVGVLDRLHGFGSTYGKALRDARPALAGVAGGLSLLLFVFGMYFADAYPTAEARTQLLDLVASTPPALKGISYGDNPVRLDTLGGYISQEVGLFLKLIPGLWSILALSGTLATEARRGSLEFVAAAPLTKRRLALEKLASHVTAMAIAATVVACVAWLTGLAFATLPGDAIAFDAALAYGIWLGLTGLAAGAVAFALAPLLGRAAAAGLAGAIMFGGYVVNAYQVSFSVFSGVANLTWFSWTADHNPLAGEYGWRSLALLVLITLALLAVGIEAFTRRDLTLGARDMPWIPRLPDITLGLRGPIHRTLSELLPPALVWGIGIGAYGLLIAASSQSFADQLAATPDIAATLGGMFPDYDITTTGGVLEASFMVFAYVLAGLAAAALVKGWAADETAGRLEMLLTSPLTRARWAISGGLGVYLAIAAATITIAVGVGIGAVVAGDEVATPVVGTLALGLHAAGLASVGLAVGGIVGTTLARPVVAGLVVVTFLADVIAPALELPDWVQLFALSAQMGQPMAGEWDPTGIAAALVLALGGLLLSGRGMRRRDVLR